MGRREKREYAVFALKARGTKGFDPDDAAYYCAERGLADLQACRKWVRDNGDARVTYLPVALLCSPLTVAVEKIEKRTLADVPVDPQKREEQAVSIDIARERAADTDGKEGE